MGHDQRGRRPADLARDGVRLLTLAVALAGEARAADAPAEVHTSIDWQGHPAMHLTWRFFADGLQDRWPYRTHRHQFRQVAYAPMLEASGVRLHLWAAMAAEKARDPAQARALILSELRAVEAFVDAHPDGWALARTPAEARRLLAETDKRVVVHAIEGGHLLLADAADAEFWAEQGVALVTLMHLRDDELGGAAILPMAVGPLINRAGARARRHDERRGLTGRGAQAIVELDRAGILVDLSHMAPDTVEDALAVTRAHGIAPVVTHGKLRRLHDSELAFTDEQVVEIYRQGGVFSLGLSPSGLDPVRDEPVPDDVCRGTIEMWRYHYDAVRAVVDAALPDADPTRRAVGWSSDWNGWVSHAAPVYGRGRCRPLDALPADARLGDTRGLPHPGLLPDWWARIAASGSDLSPAWRSAERFLQLWEAARGERAPLD